MPDLPAENTDPWYDGLAAAWGSVPEGLSEEFVSGVDGRKYRIVAGAIRNEGSGWTAIEDGNHRASNIGAVSSDAGSIYVDYSALGVSRIVGFVVTPDEALARAGFFCGASVGLTSARIELSRIRPLADYVSWDGTQWVSQGGVFAATSWASGVLTLTHEAVTGNGRSLAITGRGPQYRPAMSEASGGLASTSVKIEFITPAGAKATVADTNMRVVVDRGSHVRPINPGDVDQTAFPNSNLWVVAVFEV